MIERRKRIMKRLLIEELERRTMLAGPAEIAMAATGVQNGSYQDFYKAQVGTEIGGPGGVGMLDDTTAANNTTFRTPMANTAPQSSSFAETASGVGQMTLTTGANTLGIGSFAMPTAGPSRSGGTGNANPGVGGSVAKSRGPAVDAAIESLFAEPDDAELATSEQDSKPARVSDRTPSIKTGRRAFDLDTGAAQATPDKAPQGVGAGR